MLMLVISTVITLTTPTTALVTMDTDSSQMEEHAKASKNIPTMLLVIIIRY